MVLSSAALLERVSIYFGGVFHYLSFRHPISEVAISKITGLNCLLARVNQSRLRLKLVMGFVA